MNNKELANKILELVGGKENIENVTHCVTRLRIIIKDINKVNDSGVKALNGIIGVNLIGNQYQVILGPKVADVYKEFEPLVGRTSKTTSTEKKKITSIIIDTFTGIFTPILPAIIGAGLLKGVLIALMFFEIAETGSDLYQLLSIFSDAVYYFLPMLLAVSTATHFKCNKYVALGIAGILVHPSLVALFGTGESVHLFGLPVTAASYGSSVLPIILSIYLMSHVERFLSKVIPTMLRTILVPLLTILIVAPITLIVIGPVGSIVSEVLASNFLSFYMNYGVIAGAIFAGFLPLMVLLGIHNGFSPVMVQSLASYGVEYLMGLNVASNSAQAGATFAVFLKTKNKDFKSLAGTAALNAIIGITEPALYGITTKLKRPLIAVMIGGAVGGAIAGFFGVSATGMGTGPIAGIPLFLTNTFIYFVISCCVAFAIAFVLTIVLGFEDVPENEYEEELEDNPAPVNVIVNNTIIEAPMNGEIVSLDKVKDNVFSSKMMGDGVAIIPNEGKVYAPFDGVVVTTFPTGHAIGIESDDGCEVLIHVGMDTVKMEGQGFNYQVEAGDTVKKGDLILTFDINKIKNAGYDLTTPVIITNSPLYANIEVTDMKEVTIGSLIINAKV